MPAEARLGPGDDAALEALAVEMANRLALQTLLRQLNEYGVSYLVEMGRLATLAERARAVRIAEEHVAHKVAGVIARGRDS